LTRAESGERASNSSCVEILLLHYTAPPVVGGVESVLGAHVRLLRRAGHEAHIVAGRGRSTREVPVTVLPLLYGRHPEVQAAHRALRGGDLRPFKVLRDRIAEELTPFFRERIVLVHNVFTLDRNLPLTAALHRLLDHQRNVRVVAWTHDLSWTNPLDRPRLRPEEPWTLLCTPRPEVTYVAISEAVQTKLVELFGLRRADVPVVPTGTSLDPFHPVQRTTRRILDLVGWDAHFPVLLVPVRITRRKNLELAVRIGAALRARGTDPLVVVTGPPGAHTAANREYLAELQRLREALGLRDGCVFLAERGIRCTARVLGDLYLMADGVLLTSTWEGFGMPVAEAGLLRVPVFCPRIPATEEVAGAHAHFFNPEDPPKRIADRILAALAEGAPALRRRVLERFTWPRILHREILPLLARLAYADVRR